MEPIDQAFWSSVKNFIPDEFGPGADHLSPELVLELDAFRQFLGAKMIVSSAFRAGDPKEHGQGLAVDIIIPTYSGKHLVDALFHAMRFKFRGIGIYPDWAYKGEVMGGLHLDMRLVEHRAMWSGRKGMGNANTYFPLDVETLKVMGLL